MRLSHSTEVFVKTVCRSTCVNDCENGNGRQQIFHKLHLLHTEYYVAVMVMSRALPDDASVCCEDGINCGKLLNISQCIRTYRASCPPRFCKSRAGKHGKSVENGTTAGIRLLTGFNYWTQDAYF